MSKNQKRQKNIVNSDLELKKLINTVTKHLDFLKAKRKNILHHSKLVNKLYEKVVKEHSKLLFTASVSVGDPISLKELKHKSNLREEKLVKYIFVNNKYLKEVNKINQMKRNVDIYIKINIFIDKEDIICKELISPEYIQECILIKYIQIILKHRYSCCENTRQIANYLNITQRWLLKKYEDIL